VPLPYKRRHILKKLKTLAAPSEKLLDFSFNIKSLKTKEYSLKKQQRLRYPRFPTHPHALFPQKPVKLPKWQEFKAVALQRQSQNLSKVCDNFSRGCHAASGLHSRVPKPPHIGLRMDNTPDREGPWSIDQIIAMSEYCLLKTMK
jgi:hypothetical protein